MGIQHNQFLMISVDFTKSSEVRKAGDQPNGHKSICVLLGNLMINLYYLWPALLCEKNDTSHFRI